MKIKNLEKEINLKSIELKNYINITTNNTTNPLTKPISSSSPSYRVDRKGPSPLGIEPGTLVTVESFTAWKQRFDAEQKELQLWHILSPLLSLISFSNRRTRLLRVTLLGKRQSAEC